MQQWICNFYEVITNADVVFLSVYLPEMYAGVWNNLIIMWLLCYFYVNTYEVFFGRQRIIDV